MRILAIESSAVTASVAILTDDVLTAEYTVNYKKTHSQTLLPMIDEICKMTETEPESFDLIAVSQGPGSLPDCVSVRQQEKALHWHWIKKWSQCRP